MTICTSIASFGLITVTVDSAVTLEFATGREYERGRKSWDINGVGCVATWGERSGNAIGRFLDQIRDSLPRGSVDLLAAKVDDYLQLEYKPKEWGLDDIGYHVAGFDSQRRPRLHHIVWGIRRPPPDSGPNHQIYHWSKHHPSGPNHLVSVYNGRNDIAGPVVNLIFEEIKANRDPRFDLGRPEDIVRCGDFIARVAAELTPGVGPPFYTWAITPDNRIVHIKNPGLLPLGRDRVRRLLDNP